MDRIEQMLAFARNCAKEAGKIQLSYFRGNHLHIETKFNMHDVVTVADKESERYIIGEIKRTYPEHAILGEESGMHAGDSEYCWVIDPLDGTTNFIHDNAPYCVSIALRSKKELLLGVVYEICRNECFWTYKGAPSYLNGNEIHVSAISNLDDSFIALGFPYATEEYKPMANHLVNTLYGNVAGLRLMGAAAVELCYIAAGRFEARIEAFIGPWDIAAGTIILQNAGGMITDFKGGDSYSSGSQVLASNGRIHRDLLNIIDNL